MVTLYLELSSLRRIFSETYSSFKLNETPGYTGLFTNNGLLNYSWTYTWYSPENLYTPHLEEHLFENNIFRNDWLPGSCYEFCYSNQIDQILLHNQIRLFQEVPHSWSKVDRFRENRLQILEGCIIWTIQNRIKRFWLLYFYFSSTIWCIQGDQKCKCWWHIMDHSVCDHPVCDQKLVCQIALEKLRWESEYHFAIFCIISIPNSSKVEKF